MEEMSINTHSRASITEACGRGDELSALANAVRHPMDIIKQQKIRHTTSTNAARVVALPISLYICLSMTARDSLSPLVNKFWPVAFIKHQMVSKKSIRFIP
jgi:hypothetical protein